MDPPHARDPAAGPGWASHLSSGQYDHPRPTWRSRGEVEKTSPATAPDTSLDEVVGKGSGPASASPAPGVNSPSSCVSGPRGPVVGRPGREAAGSPSGTAQRVSRGQTPLPEGQRHVAPATCPRRAGPRPLLPRCPRVASSRKKFGSLVTLNSPRLVSRGKAKDRHLIYEPIGKVENLLNTSCSF